MTPDGSRLYAANYATNTVSVINTASDGNVIVATIPVGSGPRDITVIP